MSKKPQKNQPNPKKPQIVDQQNQPFLRAICKRVRNINKKLTEISDLKKKQDLKPEQIQKINRKTEYEQQRDRLQNIADFFRQVYAQNTEHYKNNQLQQLDALANAIAVLRGKNSFKETDKLNELNRALTEQSTAPVNENAKNIAQILRRFAGDCKVKKQLAAFVEQTQPVQQQQEKIQQSVQQQTLPQVKAEEPVKETPIVVQQPVVAQKPIQETQVQGKIIEQTQLIVKQAISEQKPVQATQQQAVQGEKRHQRGNNKTRGEYRSKNDNTRGGPRENRGPREPRQYREPREPRQFREPREPRQYRKQGQEEEGERRRNNVQQIKKKANYKAKEVQQGEVQAKREEDFDSDSSLQREPAMRSFKKEQIKQLVDQGFTVVGKPKPKAKQGQKDWHEHTHGKKAHHHNKAQNN